MWGRGHALGAQGPQFAGEPPAICAQLSTNLEVEGLGAAAPQVGLDLNWITCPPSAGCCAPPRPDASSRLLAWHRCGETGPGHAARGVGNLPLVCCVSPDFGGNFLLQFVGRGRSASTIVYILFFWRPEIWPC